MHNDSLGNALIDLLTEEDSVCSNILGSCHSSTAPPHVMLGKKVPTQPLTISLTADLIRKARVLAATKGITVSRLIAGVLADAIARELPAAVADLRDSEEDER